MPSGPLYDLPDVVADPQPQLLPVEQPQQQYDYLSATSGRPRVVIQSNPNVEEVVKQPVTVNDTVNKPNLVAVDHDPFATVKKIKDRLLGTNGEERYQLWPEKVVREALSAAGDAYNEGLPAAGLRRTDFTDIPTPDNPTDASTGLGKLLGIAPVAWSPADKSIEQAQAMSALAGTGGLAGVGSEAGVALGSTPFLRPALKYGDRLYKGKEGQQHIDVIPNDLYPTFQKQAMNGEDISNFNFGFMNHKGQFMDRDAALKYAVENGLVEPEAAKFGALTSTLLADSSKPGTAIEAMAHTRTPEFKNWFGDSKVINDKGEPLTVYHGTNQPIEQFDLSRGGTATGANAGAKKAFFFTDNAKVADQYATNAGERIVSNIAKFEKDQANLKKEVDRLEKVAQRTGQWEPYEKAMAKWEDLEIGATREDASVGKNIVNAHLAIKNPLEVDFKGGRPSAAKDIETLIDQAKKKGHDGLILKNLEDSPKMGITSTHYAVFNPNQIKSATGNSGKFDPKNANIFMADSSKPGAALQANKPTFYSALEHNVNQIQQPKMTGDQWLGTLANKPGVRPEELQWTGLSDFLKENAGKPVTKAQIEEHLASNKVELKEVNKGGKEPTLEELDRHALETYGDTYGNLPNLQKMIKESVKEEQNLNPTKYHSYQLPNGSNYREMLLTLPDRSPQKYTADTVRLNRAASDDVSWQIDVPGNSFTLSKKKFPDEIDAVKHIIETKKPPVSSDTYKSSHWDEPNILAHVRMNDRTIDGKKSLHLEEIQSDWHQEGRTKGYKDKATQDKTSQNYFEKSYNDLDAKDKSFVDEKLSNAIPDLPFKKTWHELALKRMLREAAEVSHKSEVANWEKMVHSNTDELAHKLVKSGHLKEICE